MSTPDPEIAAYNQDLVRALRSTDVEELRRLATAWGERLGNRGLKQLAKASSEIIERRMWMMIYDRPDLSDLHERAETWFDSHEEPEAE